MLIRISLIVAILAGLAVGALNFVKVKDKITTLMSERDSEKKQKEDTQLELASKKKDLDRTTKERDQLKTTLATTTTERDEALAKAEAQNKRANDLSENLAKTQKDRDDAQARLAAYVATGKSAQQVLDLTKDLKDSQDALAAVQGENKILADKIKSLNVELAKYRGENPFIYLPANLKGKIVVADPKWDFVILNVGGDQGVLPEGELLVSRGGKLDAKVIVRTVQKDRCIANVMPGWKLGEVLEGDQVIPAHPAS